jgi:hypothetical protein
VRSLRFGLVLRRLGLLLRRPQIDRELLLLDVVVVEFRLPSVLLEGRGQGVSDLSGLVPRLADEAVTDEGNAVFQSVAGHHDHAEHSRVNQILDAVRYRVDSEHDRRRFLAFTRDVLEGQPLQVYFELDDRQHFVSGKVFRQAYHVVDRFAGVLHPPQPFGRLTP